MNEYFWRPKDIAELLECSMSKAYKIVQQFNSELSAMGKYTMAGRVPKQYAIDRLGLEARGFEQADHKGTSDHSGRSAGLLRGRNHGGLSVRLGASR